MTKRPALRAQPRPTKTPRIAVEPTRLYERNPSWRVRRLELVDPFGWHILDEVKLREIRSKLADFETMTWNDILVKAKQQNHYVAVSDLCQNARKRLAAMHLDDIDELVSLRLSGRQRVWGIFTEGVLQLLWWDPDHAVCPSLLKNT